MQRPAQIHRVRPSWTPLILLTLLCTILWAAKTVLQPLALGIILAFMLTPLVRLLDRCGLPRFAAVALTLLLAGSVVVSVGYVLSNQVTELATQLNQYNSSMRSKVAALRSGSGRTLRQLTNTVDKITAQLGNDGAEKRTQLVRIAPAPLGSREGLEATLHAVFEPLASALIVIVLVGFLLAQREDLRDRLIGLMGSHNVTLTTRLLDEAAERVSRYLVAQTLINMGCGILVGLGLYWIGVPYAALWGCLCAILRFVPYVGTLMSAVIPLCLAFATLPGWTGVLLTLGLFAVLDFTAAYVVEPVVLGRRTGVSSFALLVSALFWIWIWGPLGLVLATPLTVCIAVLGRNVRSMKFLGVLFAEEPALKPHVRFYQRLLARDANEASDMLKQRIAASNRLAVTDEVILPALALANQHYEKWEISTEDLTFITEITAEIMELGDPNDSRPAAGTSPTTPLVILPTRTSPDQLVAQLLGHTLDAQASVACLGGDTSVDGMLARAIACEPRAVIIVSISPSRGAEVRTLCRRLRSTLPDCRILVLRPGLSSSHLTHAVVRLQAAGADSVTTRIADTLSAAEEYSREMGTPEHAHVPLAPATDRVAD